MTTEKLQKPLYNFLMGLSQNSYESLDQIQETIYARNSNKKQQVLKHKEETTMTKRFYYCWARLFENFQDVILLKSIHEIELEQLKQANVEAPTKLLKVRKIKQFLCERSEKQQEHQSSKNRIRSRRQFRVQCLVREKMVIRSFSR